MARKRSKRLIRTDEHRLLFMEACNEIFRTGLFSEADVQIYMSIGWQADAKAEIVIEDEFARNAWEPDTPKLSDWAIAQLKETLDRLEYHGLIRHLRGNTFKFMCVPGLFPLFE